MHLPFLVAHGALVWKVALVVLTAATCLAAPGFRPRRREEARRYREQYDRVTAPFDDVRVILALQLATELHFR